METNKKNKQTVPKTKLKIKTIKNRSYKFRKTNILYNNKKNKQF